MTNDEVRRNNGSPNDDEDVARDVFAFLALSFVIRTLSFSFVARSCVVLDFDRARSRARDNQHLAISNPKTTLALCEFSSLAARVSLGRILSKHYSLLAMTSPFSTISTTFTIRGLSARMWRGF